MATSLKAENIIATNGGFRLEVPSFELCRGEILSLIGKSGSGKSTFLNVLAGFVSPSRGKIWSEGAEITALPPEKRRLAYVFQKGGLFPHLTVFANLEFPLKVQGRADRAKLIDKMAERLGIGGLKARLPQEISGGEAQRVAIGRALLTGFPFMLLDEPFSSLDVALRQDLRGLLKELVAEHNIGAILVTHDPEDVKRLSQRVHTVESGKVSPVKDYE